jgi:hypothetical protein
MRFLAMRNLGRRDNARTRFSFQDFGGAAQSGAAGPDYQHIAVQRRGNLEFSRHRPPKV